MSAVQVPADFPSSRSYGAVAGAQPKLLVTKVGDEYVAPLGDESLTRQRYLMCEDLLQQLTAYRERKASENPDWPTETLSTKIDTAVRQKAPAWGLSPAEVSWLLRRLSQESDASKR